MSSRSKWGEGSSTAKEEAKEDNTICMTWIMSRMSLNQQEKNTARSMSLYKKII